MERRDLFLVCYVVIAMILCCGLSLHELVVYKNSNADQYQEDGDGEKTPSRNAVQQSL